MPYKTDTKEEKGKAKDKMNMDRSKNEANIVDHVLKLINPVTTEEAEKMLKKYVIFRFRKCRASF